MIDSKELSADQKYLHDICSAVINGHCSFDLSLRNPKAINHDRWLTTGNRILRMYIGSENPIPELITLATFVIRVYAPMWFCIKAIHHARMELGIFSQQFLGQDTCRKIF